MKNLLTLLYFLLACLGLAQDPPGLTRGQADRLYMSRDLVPFDIAHQCQREGFIAGAAGFYSGTPSAGATSTFGLVPPTGQAFYVESITVSVSRACDLRIQYTPPSNLQLNLVAFDIGVAGQSPVTVIPVRAILWGGGTIGGRVENEAGGVALTVRAAVNGYRIADDPRLEASKSILMIGDSIQATGPSSGSGRDALAVWQLLGHIRDNRKDYRLIMKQAGGSTSTNAEMWRRYGYLDLPFPPSLILYQMGVNDAGQAMSAATYQANWSAFTTWALARWPQCKILMLGPTPIEDNTAHAAAETLRSNMSAFVTGLNNPRVKYLNLGTAFDRTVSSNYTSSDTPGARVHPSNAGNTAIGTVLKNWATANLSWIP